MSKFTRRLGGVLVATMLSLGFASMSYALNMSIENSVENLGDLSKFDEAMTNSGVSDGLQDGHHYTIFAPTNSAFGALRPETYPCFYSAECKPAIAALIQNHILIGRYSLKELVSHGSGIQTAGTRLIHVEEPYVGDYTVDGNRILSTTDVDGNIIYRIDGLLSDPEEMRRFKTVSSTPTPISVTDQESVIIFSPDATMPEDVTETTIIQHTTVEP